jgi:hypothetical protein
VVCLLAYQSIQVSTIGPAAASTLAPDAPANAIAIRDHGSRAGIVNVMGRV